MMAKLSLFPLFLTFLEVLVVDLSACLIYLSPLLLLLLVGLS